MEEKQIEESGTASHTMLADGPGGRPSGTRESDIPSGSQGNLDAIQELQAMRYAKQMSPLGFIELSRTDEEVFASICS